MSEHFYHQACVSMHTLELPHDNIKQQCFAFASVCSQQHLVFLRPNMRCSLIGQGSYNFHGDETECISYPYTNCLWSLCHNTVHFLLNTVTL